MFAPHSWIGPPAEGDRRPAPTGAERGEAERCVRGFASTEERSRIVAWLEAGLRPGRPGRLEREYPACFAPTSSARPITAWLGTEPAAFCLLLPTRFALGAGCLRTGLISLVYTDPRFRGRGLARRVVAQARAEARAAGLGLCLLWSEPTLADFYAAQGFTRAGSETLLAFDAAILAAASEGARPETQASATALEVGCARFSDWPAIRSLRAARTCHAALPGEAADWLGIPDLEIRVARRGEAVVGFAMRGRGDDFPGVVHEWGGETDAVLRCCAALLPEQDDAGLLLLSPRETSSLTWRLRQAGARLVRGPLAWMQIADEAAFAADLASIVPELTAISLTERAPGAAGPARLRIANTRTGCALEVEPADWLARVFGPDETAAPPRPCPALTSLLPSAAAAQLPLPFFVWGLESI